MKAADEGLQPLVRQLLAAKRLSDLIDHRLKQKKLLDPVTEKETQSLFSEVFRELETWPKRLENPGDSYTRTALSRVLEKQAPDLCPAPGSGGLVLLARGFPYAIRS